ncbi:MAG: phosphoribosyltransferase family protein [Sphaerochaetaceae bacterium]|jgi:hypoxanthine phosphoribosyltransferase|nr:phosphoribosyltransferase family protein [Sphaerochaetaceae bacterium]
MRKEFISAETIRDSALKLAHKMYKVDGFVPDIIYVSLRGGVYMGNVFSEYYKMVRALDGGRPVFYAAVVARSYSDVRCQSKVMVDGWTYSPEYLRSGDKILIVDDIFDTGKTVNALCDIVMQKGIPRSDIKIAVYDYKVPLYKKTEPLPVQPDYYCRKHILNTPEDEVWIHYLCHEFVGLAPDEIDQCYKDPEVRAILHEVRRDR